MTKLLHCLCLLTQLVWDTVRATHPKKNPATGIIEWNPTALYSAEQLTGEDKSIVEKLDDKTVRDTVVSALSDLHILLIKEDVVAVITSTESDTVCRYDRIVCEDCDIAWSYMMGIARHVTVYMSSAAVKVMRAIWKELGLDEAKCVLKYPRWLKTQKYVRCISYNAFSGDVVKAGQYRRVESWYDWQIEHADTVNTLLDSRTYGFEGTTAATYWNKTEDVCRSHIWYFTAKNNATQLWGAYMTKDGYSVCAYKAKNLLGDSVPSHCINDGLSSARVEFIRDETDFKPRKVKDGCKACLGLSVKRVTPQLL